MSQVRPFNVSISDAKLALIRERVAAYRWFPAPENEQGFAYGMSTPVLQDLCKYWLNDYDWRAQEDVLNEFPHFKADVGGMEIHFVHVVGEAEGKRPLLLTHGWPGSFYEFWDAIEPLAFPSRHGGNSSDAFDLVIPSLPGYAFSEKPASPIGQRGRRKATAGDNRRRANENQYSHGNTFSAQSTRRSGTRRSHGMPPGIGDWIFSQRFQKPLEHHDYV